MSARSRWRCGASSTITITVAAGLGYATEHIVTASGQEDERSYWIMGV